MNTTIHVTTSIGCIIGVCIMFTTTLTVTVATILALITEAQGRLRSFRGQVAPPEPGLTPHTLLYFIYYIYCILYNEYCIFHIVYRVLCNPYYLL